MQRVMIVGGPGSGKSTLARALGAVTGLPVVHIDRIHWKPGWVPADRAEKDRLCHKVHMQDRWIFEGGHSVTWPERLERADTLVWLDLPVALRQWRVFRRTLRDYGRSRADLPDACPERFDRQTLEFYRYIWSSRARVRRRISDIFAAPPPHLRLVHLQRPWEVTRYVDAVREAQ
ncbi:hypothetical protein [Pelagovum pacificum]|uniref:AAA family ATPase n=1 Tax=Pelagovum pacificum TaxID=2588711 RepID=A0A5C5GGW6_9RHOB|nr:hypothetical protein [Pelagovum pacificum]QQA43686.1 hypothetical protein I8N54_03665 [Pelagovum pacificum]TNY33181.1 hypothetical protein FHY64_07865 [Pelagovum pacificum]